MEDLVGTEGSCDASNPERGNAIEEGKADAQRDS